MAEMSSLVKQASEKVVALEQLVSVLKTQVKIAERRAGVAEVCSSWHLLRVRSSRLAVIGAMHEFHHIVAGILKHLFPPGSEGYPILLSTPSQCHIAAGASGVYGKPVVKAGGQRSQSPEADAAAQCRRR